MHRIAVVFCSALGSAGILAAAATGVRAGATKTGGLNERYLAVTLVTPTINQQTLSDLSDPGLNNTITVRFSSEVNPRDFIDNQNVVNGLTPKVEFLNSTFARLPGTPSVRRNVFTFSPLSASVPALPPGQYTLNLRSSIRNLRGHLLNQGAGDFTTTFSVETDLYPPVLRSISPIDGENGIGLNQKIIATFNEPIDAGSIAAAIAVQDASTNPPTPIPGAGGTGLKLERGGFDVVFSPDPCFGYPAKTNIQFIVQGQSTATTSLATLTDVFQNKFTLDPSIASPSLRWSADPTIAGLYHSPLGVYDTSSGQFKMTFQTKGVKPPPVGLRPGGSQMTFPPVTNPCGPQFWFAPSCDDAGKCVHFTTDNGFGELDLRGFIARFNQGDTDLSLISVLANSPVRTGRPAGAAFDPRIIPGVQVGPVYVLLPSSMHTFIYLVDQRSKSVQVVRSDNFKVIGNIAGFSDPRDVSVSTNLPMNATSLYVSDYGANQLVAVDLEGIAVTFTGQPGAPTPCQSIKDNQKHRVLIPVAAGPTEVSADCYLQSRVMVCNTLANSVTLVDVRSNKVLKTVTVGSNPVSCDWIIINLGAIKPAMIANQGGLNDPNGSVSFYFNSPTLQGFFPAAAQTRDGIESTLTDGVKNPTHVWGNQKWIDPPPPPISNGTLSSIPRNWLLSNTGGNTVLDLRIAVTGLFGLSITPGINATVPVGPNPSSSCMDPYYPNFIGFSSVLGTGSVAAYNPARSVPPVEIRVPGAKRLFTCFTN